MDKFRWIKKGFTGLHILKGDSLSLEANGRTILHEVFDRDMIIDEAGIFECIVDGKYGVGGVFLERK